MSECPITEGLKFIDEIYCPFKEGHWDCPDPCSVAPILKLLAEAKEVGRVKVLDLMSPEGGEMVEFLIRRQG